MLDSLINKTLAVISPKEREKVHGQERSSQWPKLRREFIKDKKCAVCGGNKRLEVHHKKPFHIYPESELDPENLIVLCEAKKNGIICHMAIGHLGSYKSFNAEVEQDAKIWNRKLLTRP
jgi:hypothetical protein